MNTFDAEEQVNEKKTCQYSVELKSIYGCPTQCWTQPENPTSVCSGNGYCGFDTDKQVSRCYCFSGYGGSMCNERM